MLNMTLIRLLLYLTVCLCRLILLFNTWKYLTRLHLSLLKVIIQFNWVGYYSSCKFSLKIKMAQFSLRGYLIDKTNNRNRPQTAFSLKTKTAAIHYNQAKELRELLHFEIYYFHARRQVMRRIYR